MYGRTEFGWFLGALTFATTAVAVLPDGRPRARLRTPAFSLLPILGWLSGLLGERSTSGGAPRSRTTSGSSSWEVELEVGSAVR